MPVFLCLVILFVSNSVFGQDTGWCYSSLQKSTMAEPDYATPARKLTDTSIEERHWLAMKASAFVYSLPDLENTQSGDEFINNFVEFVERGVAEQIPGYHYFDSYSNRQSGLKFAIFAPDDSSAPWIFSFAGSETAIDWLADLSMGRDQIAHMETMVKKMLDCLTIDNSGDPIAGKNWIITGHSLGGGLAQIFAYKVQSLRTLMRMTPGRIELVTFNGFGALELALPNSAAAEIVIPQMLTSNYFVTGDIVSRIGQHVGQTVEIPTDAAGIPLIRVVQRHLMGTVEELLAPGGIINLNQTQRVAPPSSDPLNNLKSAGRTLGFLSSNHSETVIARLESVNILHQAVIELSQHPLIRPIDAQLTTYLQTLASEFKDDLESEVQTDFRDQLINDLENILTKIQTRNE